MTADFVPQVLALPPTFLLESDRSIIVAWMSAHCEPKDESAVMSTLCRWAKNPPGTGALLERTQALFAERWGLDILPTHVICRIREHRSGLRTHVDPPTMLFALSVPLTPACALSPIHVHGHGCLFASVGEAIVMPGSKLPHWRAPNPGPTAYWLVIFVTDHPAERYRRINGVGG